MAGIGKRLLGFPAKYNILEEKEPHLFFICSLLIAFLGKHQLEKRRFRIAGSKG